MKFKNLFYTFTVSIILFNCSSSSTEDLSNTEPDSNPTQKITYDTDIKGIITNHCIQCHGNPPTQNAPSSYTTYTQVSNNVNTILSRINSPGASVMPPSGQIPLASRQLIQKWKDDGLLEN